MFNYTSNNPNDSLSDDELIASSDLYPELPLDQRQEAIRNLHRYFEVIHETWEEQEAKGTAVHILKKAHLREQWEKGSISEGSKKENTDTTHI